MVAVNLIEDTCPPTPYSPFVLDKQAQRRQQSLSHQVLDLISS